MAIKVFISQPMNGLTDDEILKAREKAAEKVKAVLNKEYNKQTNIEIIDSFFKDAPQDVSPLWYLGESLKLLSQADVAVFIGEWRKARGCRVEYNCAVDYGIKILAPCSSDSYLFM